MEPAVVAAAPVPIPAARVYFNVDSAALPSDVSQTLADVLAYLKAHPTAKAAVTGFHDPQGNVSKAYNERLARDRAIAVHDRLQRWGIPADRLVMAKPAEATVTGSLDEARRVEVSVQP